MAGSLILEYNVKGVDDTREPTKTCQQDVDKKVNVASSLKENSQWREDDGYSSVSFKTGAILAASRIEHIHVPRMILKISEQVKAIVK